MADIDQSRLFADLDRLPELKGIGVARVGDGTSQVLRPSQHSSGLNTYLVIERTAHSTPMVMQPGSAEARLRGELVGLGLNCGAVVLSIVAVGLAPKTLGGSAVLYYAAIAATGTDAAQCGNSIGRAVNELIDPVRNDSLDANVWYRRVADVLDVISLIDAFTSLPDQVKGLIRSSKSSGRPFARMLKEMDGPQSKRLGRELGQFLRDTSIDQRLKPF